MMEAYGHGACRQNPPPGIPDSEVEKTSGMTSIAGRKDRHGAAPDERAKSAFFGEMVLISHPLGEL